MRKMNKLLTLILVLALTVGLMACGSKEQEKDPDNENPVTEDNNKTPDDENSTTQNNDEAISSGKIAVIRNMTSSDHTAQFFAGCIAEGEELGYEVDTFMSDGDDVKMQDLMEQALQQDYDIWIVSHANEGYQYDMITRAREKGIFVSCFDCGGEHVPGVTYTSQNDQALASMSLDAMIEKVGGDDPVKMLEVNTLGALVPFDNRHAAVEQYVQDGKLEVVNLISPTLVGDFYTDCYNGVSTTLAQDTGCEIKGIWTSTSTFLDGIIDAVKDSGRDDVVVTAIDISDTEIIRLTEEPMYYCCAAVDPYVIGIVNVRLAVLNSLGIETPETVELDAVAITSDKITAEDTMATLSNYFDGFGSTELYNEQALKGLKAQVAGN